MFKFELYCGLVKSSDSLASFIETSEFIIAEASKLELDVSILNTVGSYTNNYKETIIEDGLLIVIIAANKMRPKVKQLADIYKTKYDQDCVLLVETEIKSEFI